MAGTKLALLKRAMGFLIENLGSTDRLLVIAFSSTARRLFPLHRMTDIGRVQALQAVNSLVANGGTNITEGLRKGAKVMEDRREKNPVASIILLSDGQDTYTVNGSVCNQSQPNYQSLLLLSLCSNDNSGFQIPVHAFGFGTDHDASSMHSISEKSGGTFLFIETAAVLQDAFAQCIGGLLSVVVKELQVGVECVHPSLTLGSFKAGNYPSHVMADGRSGFIDVGDLYADEERDFLVSVNVPAELSRNETSLLKVRCCYKDPLTKEMVTFESDDVRIERPEIPRQEVVSIEVDRQRNRLQAAEEWHRQVIQLSREIYLVLFLSLRTVKEYCQRLSQLKLMTVSVLHWMLSSRKCKRGWQAGMCTKNLVGHIFFQGSVHLMAKSNSKR